MNLIEIDREYFITVRDVRSALKIGERIMDSNMEQYAYVGSKRIDKREIGGQTLISCKSAHRFLGWYMERGWRKHDEIANFRHCLSKYIKKIPKRAISRVLRGEIAYRQRYACNICGLFPIPPDYQIDHINELQDGGRDVASNLQALCVPCHNRKTREHQLRRLAQFSEEFGTESHSEEFDTESHTTSDQEQEKPVFSKYFRR